MGLFSPKMNDWQRLYVTGLLKKLNESANLVNTTLKPDVFFGRLNVVLDTLMELSRYEKYKGMSGTKPSDSYAEVLRDLKKTVNNFIDRSYQKEIENIGKLKTVDARERRMEKYFDRMFAGFECCHTFWTGSYTSSGPLPHYTGPLYTNENWQYLESLQNGTLGEY